MNSEQSPCAIKVPNGPDARIAWSILHAGQYSSQTVPSEKGLAQKKVYALKIVSMPNGVTDVRKVKSSSCGSPYVNKDTLLMISAHETRELFH
eukprot:scaffold117945_cov15-Prasinocladus_malaysianus.AAC.1